MASYTNLFGSNFPSSIMVKREFKDVNAEMLPYVTAYFEAMMNNNYNKAQMILTDSLDESGNIVDLSPYIINAFIFNWLLEEIRNTQIYAKTKGQQIVYVDSIDELPENPVDGDIYRIKKG